jgi:D-aspartate ligase
MFGRTALPSIERQPTVKIEESKFTQESNVLARDAVGALIVGGDHPGLGIARSLGRRGIPVYVIDDEYSICSFSRYVNRVIRVRDLKDERKTVDAVLEVGRRFHLDNWVLFPTRDETVAAFSRYWIELATIFRMTTSRWDTVQWAWNKDNTYKLAEKLQIPCPQTFTVRGPDELSALNCKLPLAIKPAIKENFFYATGAKAWRADTPDELVALFKRARRYIRPDEILIQEIIPGDGEYQFSYCAFFAHGEPHSTLVAKRMRQHPREFGRAASYVETVECPLIEELSKRFLKEIDYYGLVEIEFKQDPRDGKFKLLDVNARAWGFHILGSACGVDFPYLQFADQLGHEVAAGRAAPGIGWIRLITDLPVVLSDLVHRRTTLASYVQSLRAVRVESVFSKDDPLPSLAELVFLPYFVVKKYF